MNNIPRVIAARSGWMLVHCGSHRNFN